MEVHGYRNYKEDMFKKAYEECTDDSECEIAVRDSYRRFESGRWYDTMDKMHNFLSRLDKDELEDFTRKYYRIVDRVNEFAIIEELREFEIRDVFFPRRIERYS